MNFKVSLLSLLLGWLRKGWRMNFMNYLLRKLILLELFFSEKFMLEISHVSCNLGYYLYDFNVHLSYSVSLKCSK